MSQFVNINEKRPTYFFIDAKCIGRRCFHAIRDGITSGCNNRKHRGCPDPLPPYEKEHADRNKVLGWRLSR